MSSNSVDVRDLLDESILEIKRAADYIVKEAAAYYPQLEQNSPSSNPSPVLKIDFQEIQDLARKR